MKKVKGKGGAAVMGAVWLVAGCTAVSREAVPEVPKVPVQALPPAVVRPVMPAWHPAVDKNDELSLALLQLDQDEQLSVPEREELFKSLVLQPLPMEAMDGLRRAQLQLLKHQHAATQDALILLNALKTDQGSEVKPYQPLVVWLSQWAREQSNLEADMDQLLRQNSQLQGRNDNLTRQIQELQAIEHHLTSRPESTYGGTKN